MTAWRPPRLPSEFLSLAPTTEGTPLQPLPNSSASRTYAYPLVRGSVQQVLDESNHTCDGHEDDECILDAVLVLDVGRCYMGPI